MMFLQFPSAILIMAFAACALSQAAPSDEDKEKVERASVHLRKLTVHRKSLFTRLLNKGTAVRIKTLPGVGDATAQRIIEGRPYKTSAYVVLVEGVGEKTFEKMVKAMR